MVFTGLHESAMMMVMDQKSSLCPNVVPKKSYFALLLFGVWYSAFKQSMLLTNILYRLYVTILVTLCGLSQRIHVTRILKKMNERSRFLSQQITSIIFIPKKEWKVNIVISLTSVLDSNAPDSNLFGYYLFIWFIGRIRGNATYICTTNSIYWHN